MRIHESGRQYASWRTTIFEIGIAPVLIAIDLSQRYLGNESYFLTIAGGAMLLHAFLNIHIHLEQSIDEEVDSITTEYSRPPAPAESPSTD